jgi:hypothetical protein
MSESYLTRFISSCGREYNKYINKTETGFGGIHFNKWLNAFFFCEIKVKLIRIEENTSYISSYE